MGQGKTAAAGSYTGRIKVYGMVDAHAHHNSGVTCPLPLLYNQIPTNLADGISRDAVETFIKTVGQMNLLLSADGIGIQQLPTTEMGSLLVELNSRFYNEDGRAHNIYANYRNLAGINEEKKALLRGRKPRELNGKEAEDWKELDDWEKEVKKGLLDDSQKIIPSLIIAPTMDMELAHIDGYEGEFIYQQVGDAVAYYKMISVTRYETIGDWKRFDITHERKNKEEIQREAQAQGKTAETLDEDDKLVFQKWKRQVKDTEAAAASNPLRLFPLFFYDPRRYRHPAGSKGDKYFRAWDEPFARMVGSAHTAKDVQKSSRVWLGFKMYPPLGHRPLDSLCKYLPDFYGKCAAEDIPILTHCAPGGMTTHDARFYKEFDMIKGRAGDLAKSGSMDYFYRNYAHPVSWRPVLEKFPKLHLCLAHFGGDVEWAKNPANDRQPLREWIREIIELTRNYDNVYTDISCLNIYGKNIRSGLTWMLTSIKEKKQGYEHLKNKLIFGSDWYLTYLTPIAKNAVYGNYCGNFRKIFMEADETGELWERVSLINPWRCYALSEKIFSSMLSILPDLADAARVKYNPDTAKKTFDELYQLNKYVEGRI